MKFMDGFTEDNYPYPYPFKDMLSGNKCCLSRYNHFMVNPIDTISSYYSEHYEAHIY
jgi:hypothetical protein